MCSRAFGDGPTCRPELEHRRRAAGGVVELRCVFEHCCVAECGRPWGSGAAGVRTGEGTATRRRPDQRRAAPPPIQARPVRRRRGAARRVASRRPCSVWNIPLIVVHFFSSLCWRQIARVASPNACSLQPHLHGRSLHDHITFL